MLIKENPEERNLLIESVRKLQSLNNKYGERMYEDIPSYLLPQIVKDYQA